MKNNCKACKIKLSEVSNEKDCHECSEYITPEYCLYCGYIFNKEKYINNNYTCYMCTEGK